MQYKIMKRLKNIKGFPSYGEKGDMKIRGQFVKYITMTQYDINLMQ